MALAKARGAAKRPDPGIADARLAELLRDYHTSAPARLADAHTRQRNLVVVDTLCVQLEQVCVWALVGEGLRRRFVACAHGSRRFPGEPVERERAQDMALRGLVCDTRLRARMGGLAPTPLPVLAATADLLLNPATVPPFYVRSMQMRPLKELPPDVAPQDFPRPPRGTERAERAAQAHALSLTDARVGKWWTHLRSLNTQVGGAGAAAAVWRVGVCRRSGWQAVEFATGQRRVKERIEWERGSSALLWR